MQFQNHNLLLLLIIICGIILLSSLGSSPENTVILPLKYQEDQAAKPAGLGNPKVHKIRENVYAITDLQHAAGKGFGLNTGIIFTAKSVIFIDSGMTISQAEFLWQIAQKRIKGDENLYLVLTHHHADHTFGMQVMKEKGANIIAHNKIIEWLKDDNGRYKRFIMERYGWDDEILGDVVLSIPDQLIEKDTVLHIDGEEVHLLITPGHTVDELSIYHPKSRTLFAGDTIYEGSAPTTRFGGAAEWKLWISQLERLKQLDIDIIVPGHGKLCSKEEIARNIAYLKGLL